jgi:glycosyltransferase involved in cell wall biosynthesis
MHVLISAVSSAHHPSGICRHAANLARGLCETAEISKVTLLVGQWQAGYFVSKFKLGDRKLQVVSTNALKQAIARNLWYCWGLSKAVGEYAPDVVHLSFPVPFARPRIACPVVVSLHDMYPYDIPENVGAPRVYFNRWFLQQCLKGSDLVACSSDFTLERLRHYMPTIAAEKAWRVHQGVGINSDKLRRPMLSEPGDHPFLLVVAQHRRNKNLGLLLLAFAELRRRDARYRKWRLVIVGGSGPETPLLQGRLRQLSLQRYVAFLSAVSDDELGWLYKNCVACVAPSTIEGFGLPVLEALACGSRVVCSDIPAFREVGGSGCEYFSLSCASPAAALADAIQKAASAPAPLAVNLDRFSNRQIASQFVAAYSRLISYATPAARQLAAAPASTKSTPYDGLAS